MVYFVRRPTDGMVKIGTTQRLAFRLPQLESDEGCRLEVLGVTDGSYTTERALHRRFAELRRDGEWFAPGDSLLAFIREGTEAWDREEHAPCVVAFRCSSSYKEHLLAVAEELERPPAQVIEFALRAYAKEHGYDPFPRR